ncbi:hypothetical protein [Ponticaulis profundi]|uniref:Regulatory protein FlaEY n=1 Tax=Ponticaulis profundi TaxID=2665222 RepID=A0ABW1S4Z0_9PROT
MVDLVPFDFSALSGYYNAKINYRLASQTSAASQAASATPNSNAVADSELPWRQEVDAKKALISAMGAGAFISDSAAREARGDSSDVTKILLAYEALAQAKVIADAALEGDLPVGQEGRAQKRILEAINDVSGFLDSVDIKKSILITGERVSVAQSEVAIARSTYEYNTKVLHEGDYDAEVAAFQGSKTFSIQVDKINSTQTVNIDLAEMGGTVRNLDNVADFINGKLEEAGIRTRFERVKVGTENEDGVIEGNQFGFKIEGVSTEQLSFSSTDTQTAAVMVGQSGGAGNSGGQFSVWTGIDTDTVERATASRLGEDENDTEFTATAVHPDGGYVVVGTTTGVVGNGETKGEQDAFLARYDSQGKMVWSRSLGAAENAEGLDIAVSSTGQIAITGVTTDKLTSGSVGGQEDTFVTLYDADGIEQWTRQRAASYDDRGTSIAFASDGSIFVGGTTASSMTNDALAGGSDSFVEKLDAQGNQVWIRQFGTSGNDSVTSVAVADDGSIIVAGTEDGEGVVRRFESDVDTPNDWSVSLGNLYGGQINDVKIAADGSVFMGGVTRAAGENATGFTATSQSDRDGFVAKLNLTGNSANLNWIQRLGGEGYQSVEGIALSGDEVIAVGTGEAVFGTGSSDKDQSAYMTSLAQTTGAQDWTHSITGRGGAATASDVVLNTNYSSTLDAFGLPDGEMVVSDTASLTDRLALRAGDHFYVAVDGGSEKKVTIEQGDNLRSLTFKINAALVLDGTAAVRRGSDGQSLKITPAEGSKIELISGSEGNDALAALGLTEGFVMEKPVRTGDDEQNDGPEIVTMGLTNKVSLETQESIQDTVDMLDTALRALRTAYRWAIDDPTLTSLQNNNSNGNTSGAVPAYLTAQISNLQAGLQRLSAGGGGGATSLFA